MEATYALGEDSFPQSGVPTGTVTRHAWRASSIYPDATHEYWVYVPAQYAPAKPACVMVFQDGYSYLDPNGAVRAATVFDNLIHRGEMPMTIGVFVNPGEQAEIYDQRQTQYVPLTDAYARFLLTEILPTVGKDLNLVDSAAGRAICGMSDGGLCAFTVAWQRPDAFSKVVSHIGSYTRLRGGSEYPFLIRNTRGERKPIRVFLQDGANDLNLTEGNWTLANLSMASALKFARYDYQFELGSGSHDLAHGGAIFPATLRWLWRDYPGVKASPPPLESVAGVWDVETQGIDGLQRSVLRIAAQGDSLAGTLDFERDGERPLSAVGFEDGILTFEYDTPPSQLPWNKGLPGPTEAWLKVAGDTFDGAISREAAPTTFDYATKGRRRTEAG